jgi:hypothetical protein
MTPVACFAFDTSSPKFATRSVVPPDVGSVPARTLKTTSHLGQTQPDAEPDCTTAQSVAAIGSHKAALTHERNVADCRFLLSVLAVQHRGVGDPDHGALG